MSYTSDNTILEMLADKNGEAPVSALINITEKYPAFGAAKYLLVKQLMREGDTGFEKYAQNAVLYFPEPFWFHFKLNEEMLMQDENILYKKETLKKGELEERGEIEPFQQPVEHTDTIAQPSAEQAKEKPEEVYELPQGNDAKINEYRLNIIEEGIHEAATEPQAGIAVEDHGIATMLEKEEEQHKEFVISETQAYILNNTTKVSGGEEDKVKAPTHLHITQEGESNCQTAIAATNILPEEVFTVSSIQPEVGPEAPLGKNEWATPIIGEVQEQQPWDTDVTVSNEEVDPGAAEKPVQTEQPTTGRIHFVFDDTGEDSDEEGQDDYDDDTQTTLPAMHNQRIASVLQEHLADFKKPVSEDTPVPIESEPYHTIDYFASQGIKLTAEQLSQDHFSVKVKKFTDWLKQMKRIAPQQIEVDMDEAAERKVKTIAAGSNEPKEVVTETMAEVLAKQGMADKAIEVYEKLSFLYPSKSAYFASQIEQLKGI
jgi:hypothetical protein